MLSASSIGTAWGNNAGIAGRSTTSNNCTNGCHGGGSFAFSASIQGPGVLDPGETGSFSVQMTRTSGSDTVFGGFDLSANSGTLNPSDSGVRKDGNELVQNTRRAVDGNTIAWGFTWSAPSAPGNYTLFVCTNPVNGDSNTGGDGPSACNTRSITVVAPNAVPVAVADSFMTSEDTVLSRSAPGVLGNDTDANGDALTAARVAEPSHGNLTLNPNGSFSYTPDANYNGPDSFTYRANDGAANSNTVTVGITVTPVNDAPVAVANPNFLTVVEGGSGSTGSNSVLSNDTDADGGPLTAMLVAGPANDSAFNLMANGRFSYTHDGSNTTTDSFTYRANDGTANSNTVTVGITITPVNDAPVAVNDSFSTAEGAPLTRSAANGVLANDTDPDGPKPTQAVLVSSVAPTAGTLVFQTNGGFTYTPAPNFSGTASFTYRARDAQNLNSDNVATVTISVSDVSSPPVAENDSYATNEDTPLTVNAAQGLLANDSDADGGTLTAVMFSVVPATQGVLATNADGSFRFTPASNFSGPVTFTYRASDGSENSSPATVTLTVNAINDAPRITSRAPSIAFDSRPFVHDVIATDVDDPTLSFLLSGEPDGMSISNTGRITWTPPSGATSSGAVTISVADSGANGAAPAQQEFTLSVRPDSALIGLPDINRNSAQDLAVLVKDGSGLKLYVKDGLDGATISTADLGTSLGQAAVAGVRDLDGDRKVELAVLTRNLANGLLRIELRSSLTGARLRVFPVLSKAFEPISLALVPDLDGSGTEEIAVLGRATTRNEVQIADLGTGAALRNIVFLNRRAEPISLNRIMDLDGNAGPELVVLARDGRTGATVVEARDASTGHLIPTPRFSRRLQAVSLAIASDLNGNGAQELVVLGRESGNGRIRVEVGDLLTATVDRSFVFFSKRYTPNAVAMLPDQNGNQSQEIAVLAKPDPGPPEVQVRDGLTGELLSQLRFLGNAFNPSGIVRSNDLSGNAISEITVLGTSTTRVRSQTLDAATGDPGQVTNYP
ncbi:MAG: Ig-like domain-containing protein [Panacagrimonas sp.]